MRGWNVLAFAFIAALVAPPVIAIVQRRRQDASGEGSSEGEGGTVAAAGAASLPIPGTASASPQPSAGATSYDDLRGALVRFRNSSGSGAQPLPQHFAQWAVGFRRLTQPQVIALQQRLDAAITVYGPQATMPGLVGTPMGPLSLVQTPQGGLRIDLSTQPF